MSGIINADLCIIGAGSGGLSVAAGAAQLGRKVVLVEKGEMGGDCLNSGCVPSKALIAAAARAHAMRTAGKFGVAAVDPQIDFNAVIDHVQGVIATIAPVDSQERFEGLGVTVLRDEAAFTGPREIKAGDAKVSARHFVIATGSRPAAPPIKGLGDTPYFTNETIFENRTLPEHLIIIGGGPIGIEMAQAFRRLGSSVSVIEADKILGKDDPELADIVRKALQAEGVNIMEGAEVERVAGGNGVSVHAGGKTVTGSHLFVAAGRTPVIDRLNLEAAGVETNKQGIVVDNRLRTTNKRIYAVGDVAGGRQFTHVAGYHASLAIRNILFKMPAANHEEQAPWVTYADPELAHVGLNEAAARERGDDITVVRWTLEENDRAQTERDTAGLIKVVAGKGGKILGASIVGKNAGELIQLWAYAISNGRKIKSFTNYIAPYPTRGEISKRAGGQYFTPALFSKRTKMLVTFLSMFD